MLLSASKIYAASPPSAARGENDGLLSRLGASGCQFKRNGSWYTAEEAQTHLRRMLDYLDDKEAVGSTEQFIERAPAKAAGAASPIRYDAANKRRHPVAGGCTPNCRNCVPGQKNNMARHTLRAGSQ